MASPYSSVVAQARPNAVPYLHLNEEVCPMCDQPIPHDRVDEIARRMEARERERSVEITSQLQREFATEKALALQKAEREAADKVAAVREETRLAAEAKAQEQLALAERAKADSEATLNAKIEKAAREKADADTARQALQDQLEELERDAAAKEEEIRAQARQAAEEAANGLIARAEAEKVAAEAEKVAAEEAAAALEQQLSAAKLEAEEAAAKAKTDADAKVAAAEAKVHTLEEAHQTVLEERLREQRDALEAAQTAAVNAEKAAAFDEKMKLSARVDDLQRALDKKTTEELGEGAEIDLYEALKTEFEGDRIERVNKGQQGADILHTVIYNGRECGTIIYDSKNHSAWRNSFVDKLKADQLAAKAEHAILSTRKFPARARQLDFQDGVILASPARVVALVIIIRQHLVSTFTLRASNEARAQKTAELYEFITSERCMDLLARFDTHADDLLDLQVREQRAHAATWKRQGELYRSVQRVRAELRNEIDSIIGTAQAATGAQ